jgi:putative transposase
MTTFRKKYRAESIRLKNWNYSSNGYYFVTICTKGLIEHFGEIKNGIMGLNEMGCIAAKFWKEIPKHFPSVTLDEWVVMPNHVHGIIGITNPPPTVETIHELSLRTTGRINHELPAWDKKQRRKMIIPKIIGRFKMQSAKQINILQNTKGNDFWQKNYYDRIIRNEKSLDAIREYIRNNPLKWEYDRNNPNYPWK